ncbi:hypothetical protein ALC60_11523 [Trachymyrmex zeteki]|uniref:Uncharacterized protein n=1 Tax=Mycetomoellerius zeteki TaxID=64791 RepID=A0A151WNN7_9HYME|nr:hypothetical protein ALC60_11523 [Trachymyrmex zeteki]
MKFDEAVNEHDGYEDSDQDPTSHHPRAARLLLHKNQSGDKPDALRSDVARLLDIFHRRNTTRTGLSIRLGSRRYFANSAADPTKSSEDRPRLAAVAERCPFPKAASAPRTSN